MTLAGTLHCAEIPRISNIRYPLTTYTSRNIENVAMDIIDVNFLIAHGCKLDLTLVDEKLRKVNHLTSP